jgi:hypothetical protein
VWVILEHKKLGYELARAPVQIRKKYETWKDIAAHGGPAGLSRIRGFNDEALAGDWKGYRSSRLSQAYRVIYRAEHDRLLVVVERVSKHDYRK